MATTARAARAAAVDGGTPTRTGTIDPGCATSTYRSAVRSTAGLFPNQILTAYGIAAALCGAWFVWRAIAFLKREVRDAMARKLFLASILYLPLVLGALVADRLLVS